MNGEVENNNEKKKQIRLVIIGVVALLLLTLGATFAFFLIDTDNSTSKSSIKGDIEDIDSIALQKVTENLHVNLNAADMAEANKNTEYYGDDTANYVKTLEEGLHTLGKLTAEGGNGTTRYMCSANAVITMEVATENDMGKYFETGDAYLYINAGSLQQRIDLSELKESGTMTIPFEIGITSKEERQIDGYVEIINTASDQTYLANKTLNIDVTFQDLECNVGVSEVETYLRDKDTDKKLTENLVNGLYRYQGNSIVNNFDMSQRTIDTTQTVNNNYICLGSDCSTEESADMYRIIGVTEDGEMKVIKNIPANNSIAWNSDYQTDIKWPESELYKYLNTDFYNTLPIELKNKILNTTWLYGDANMNDLYSNPRIMELMGTLQVAENELAKKEVATELAKLMATETINLESQNATSKTIGNISLMSATDYCSSFESDKDLTCISSSIAQMLMQGFGGGDGTIDTSLLGLTWLTPSMDIYSEWTMSRSGFGYGGYGAWYVSALGYLSYNVVTCEYETRPVFYLTSDVDIKGLGTIGDPFRIGIE